MLRKTFMLLAICAYFLVNTNKCEARPSYFRPRRLSEPRRSYFRTRRLNERRGFRLTSRRHLEEEKEEKKPYAEFLSAVTNTVSVVDSVTNTAKNVIGLFKSSSSEDLVKEMEGRGYDHLAASTIVIIKKNIKIEAFFAVMRHSLKGMNIPEKHREGINSLVQTAMYIEQNSWHENDVTFDIGQGGMAKNFQVFTYRSMAPDGCETMQFILIGSTVAFKLAPDIFLISHSSSKMGGAFTKQRLEWKNVDRPLDNDKDLEFVNKYFRTLSLSLVQELPNLFNINPQFTVRCLGPVVQQEDPFADDDFNLFEDTIENNDYGSGPRNAGALANSEYRVPYYGKPGRLYVGSGWR